MTGRSCDVGRATVLVAEVLGPEGGPPLVLVPGVAMQLVSWPQGLVDALVDAGLRVVRYDGRDSGASTHGPDDPAYALVDLAADLRGLLDALELPRAHLLGVSMGGMVAQALAISDPDRVASLTSVSSTTGRREDTESDPAAAAALLAPPPVSGEEAAAHGEAVHHAIGSAAGDLDGARARAVRAFERETGAGGVTRQWRAVMTRGQDRTEGLRGLRVPTLVVHGEQDRLIGPRGGVATAAASQAPSSGWCPAWPTTCRPSSGRSWPRAWPPWRTGQRRRRRQPAPGEVAGRVKPQAASIAGRSAV